MEKPVQVEGFYFPAGSDCSSNLRIQNHDWFVRSYTQLNVTSPAYQSRLLPRQRSFAPARRNGYNASTKTLFVTFQRPKSSANVDVHLIIFMCNNTDNFQILQKRFTFPKGEKWIEVEFHACISESFASYSVMGIVLVSLPVSCKTDDKKSNVGSSSSSDVISSQLSKDLACLLDSDVSSDYVLRCAGQEFPVHKCILAARSSVFAAMFRFYKNAEAEVPMTKAETTCDVKQNFSKDCSQETSTTSNQAEDIMDMKPEILKKMLKYIYSGQIDDLTSTEAGDLLYAADKYQLDLLKKICVDKLKSTLSPSNFLDMLVIGDLHDESLKTLAMNFICEYPLSELKKMDQWKLLQTTNPAMVNEVLTSVVGYLQDSKK